MKHVRLRMTANGRESEVHPLYDLLANGACVERAAALQWNRTGETMGFLYYIVGDSDAFEAVLRDIEEVIEYALEPVGEHAFYAYLHDEMTPVSKQLFEPDSYRGIVVAPPMQYQPDGDVLVSVFGPAERIQTGVEVVPNPVEVEIESVGGPIELPQAPESYLSERQYAALSTAIDLGYYDVPREASQADVADALDCAPSTVAEHLRKGETKLVRSVLQQE